MEDVTQPHFTDALAVIVAWGMSEAANKAFVGMELLPGARWVRGPKRSALADRGR
ncbi:MULTISPECIES: hypothetical protein [unclassified Caballeronia]|uniref:hypothetical protein n=1 Tax=unclassified Caballeronia TaxID=2646786 RepID=UPI0013EDAB44|nr:MULTISPECIES: hypothetical protein [unclassified Caballeronia]